MPSWTFLRMLNFFLFISVSLWICQFFKSHFHSIFINPPSYQNCTANAEGNMMVCATPAFNGTLDEESPNEPALTQLSFKMDGVCAFSIKSIFVTVYKPILREVKIGIQVERCITESNELFFMILIWYFNARPWDLKRWIKITRAYVCFLAH